MHVEKDVDGDRATFIFWAPDFEPSTGANGNTAFEQDTWISAKTRNFRKLIKLMKALSMYNTKNQVMNFFLCTKCCDSCEKKKHFAQRWAFCSALAQIILLIHPICLFVQFSFFLVDDLVSNYGQQFVFQMDDNLFSSCHSGVPAGKVQGSELSLDMLLLSAAATRQVIMGYKCEHEGCQKSFESRKRHNVHRQRNCGKSYETSSSGANSFRAARRMLSAQSFISSPMSSLRIKVCIAGICENRSCE